MAAGRLKVVVIDDSPTILGLFELELMPPDDRLFEIAATALDASSGLEAVKTHRPDVVIIDYELPGTDGVELMRQVLALRPTTAVFLVSSHRERAGELEWAAVATGAVEFLPKPESDDLMALRRQIEASLRGSGLLKGR